MKAILKRTAFTLVEVVVTISVLCLLAVMVIPMLQRTRVKSDWGSCINRVKQIGLSFRLWAEDNGGSFPMQTSITNGGTLELTSGGNAAVHFRALSNYLSTPTAVWCPQDSGRTRASSFSLPFANSNVSYFVNMDAAVSRSHVVLVGDRKLTMDGVQAASGLLSLSSNSTAGWTRDIHQGKGNIVFVDGHAEQGGSGVLGAAVARSGPTIRLAVP
jgi:prepilin-type processing-associated H-X9-DG protein/prepilin-type N-terminal cleavage/methylation domain-containing protein